MIQNKELLLIHKILGDNPLHKREYPNVQFISHLETQTTTSMPPTAFHKKTEEGKTGNIQYWWGYGSTEPFKTLRIGNINWYNLYGKLCHILSLEIISKIWKFHTSSLTTALDHSDQLVNLLSLECTTYAPTLELLF